MPRGGRTGPRSQGRGTGIVHGSCKSGRRTRKTKNNMGQKSKNGSGSGPGRGKGVGQGRNQGGFREEQNP